MRPHDDKGWIPLGTCQVRFEGEEGWVETGDSNEVAVYPESLRTERTAFEKVGTFPISHLRDFFDCVKSRGADSDQCRYCPVFARCCPCGGDRLDA